MYWISKSIHKLNRFWRQLIVFLSVLGPGIIVMIADNDVGGISTYAVTSSKYGLTLLWIFIPLIPMAYFVQEMTVRLGAVTKRGHAELPSSLVFLILLLNDKSVMGDRVNTNSQNIMNWSIVIFVAIMSSLMGIGTLFPNIFK
jgi:Mn2+/Fe2+ NRAMP family transporter